MLNTSGRPPSNITPISFYPLQGINSTTPIVLNDFPLSLITTLQAVRRDSIGLTKSGNNIIDAILIIRRLHNKYRGFYIFGKISSIIAMIVLIIEFLNTLRNRKAEPFLLNEIIQTRTPLLDGLISNQRRIKLSNKQPTIRYRQYLRSLRVLQEIISVKESCNPAC